MGKVVEFPPQPGSPEPKPLAKPLWRHVAGGVLRTERLEQGRILTEVAATAGVSPQYLSEVERGRKEPSSEVLGSVAQALGLDLVDVVARVAGRLGAARDDERRSERERELVRRRPTAPFGAAAPAPGHPLDLTAPADAHSLSVITGTGTGVSSAEVFLLVA
ncbi:helix-turn-helix domain-containing protein [Agromyces ramosus]|uniref:Transcriptional regulator with XRE-family HTH domain n=1 Tax=Agromyces ramosus TaxID=33879 RepID=A0ABU0RAL1_9MICO|nr:helix-turn-helix transcriptional regulator [Agromyces ramosus]MDQ0895114.1 transcriptional regulator with XRE-family HTH domain [Agromyces ramosus]